MSEHETEIRDCLERGLHIDPYNVRGILRELDELRKDKARLDWLERPQQITHYVNPFRDVVHRINSGQTLREAIDAAMGETK